MKDRSITIRRPTNSENYLNSEDYKTTERNKLKFAKTPKINLKLETENQNINKQTLNDLSIKIRPNPINSQETLNIENINNVNDNNNFENQMNSNCLICEEKLTNEEMINNFFGCFHGFCNFCLKEYFKEKINNNIIDIKCPKEGCENKINDYFIENYLINSDIPLLDKYKKYKYKKQLLINPEIQICPFPDCESYAKKDEKDKYVMCKKGHKFCLNCLKPWHGNEQCIVEVDENFENWKKERNVQKCPRCKYYIEKISGCNHMTCTNCRYEWCWICRNEYKEGHYGVGQKCEGLLFDTEPNYLLVNAPFIYRVLKILLFWFIFPFFFICICFGKIFPDIADKLEDIAFIFFISILILMTIVLYVPLFSIGSIVVLIMIFYWPFQRKMLNIFYD